MMMALPRGASATTAMRENFLRRSFQRPRRMSITFRCNPAGVWQMYQRLARVRNTL